MIVRSRARSTLYPAAVIMFDVGIIVGAHKTATIANAIQGELSKLLESPMEGHEFGMKDWGVFYHSKSGRMDHVWYIECSSAGVQEVVATALKELVSHSSPPRLVRLAALTSSHQSLPVPTKWFSLSVHLESGDWGHRC